LADVSLQYTVGLVRLNLSYSLINAPLANIAKLIHLESDVHYAQHGIRLCVHN